MKSTRVAVWFASLSILMACSDSNPAAPPQNDPALRSAESADEANLRLVSRALALGLGDQEVRAGVRDAMRASRFNEHKLVLQEFTATPGGVRLVGVAARAVRVSPEELMRAIAQLPPLDFYAPFRDHRLNWKGTGDLVVAATMDVDNPLITGFTVSGVGTQFRIEDGVPRQPMLILHPSEYRAPRERPQPDTTPGLVIEESTDRPLRNVSFAQSSICGRSAGYLTLCWFKTHFDDGWAGSSEVEFRALEVAPADAWTRYPRIKRSIGVARQTGVEKDKAVDYYAVGGKEIGYMEIGSVPYVDVVETDATSDDYYGSLFPGVGGEGMTTHKRCGIDISCPTYYAGEWYPTYKAESIYVY